MSTNTFRPNQWYTPVFVRVYRISTNVRIQEEHFSDLQMAWIWIKNEVGEIGDNIQDENFLRSFDRTVDRLNEAHTDNQSGCVCAENDDLQYCVFYRISNVDDRSRFSVR